MNNNKITISHSSIQVFHNCKRKFKHKYIDRLQSQQYSSNKYMSFGQSVHTTLAKFNLLKNSEDKTLENLHEYCWDCNLSIYLCLNLRLQL